MKRYEINPKIVAKWKKRGSVADLPTGSKDAASTVLSVEGRSGDRRLPQAYAAAAGRLPLCASADDSASNPLVIASLPAAPWNLKAARG